MPPSSCKEAFRPPSFCKEATCCLRPSVTPALWGGLRRYATLRYATLRFAYASLALRYATLRYASLHYATLPLRFATLRFASLLLVTLHYINNNIILYTACSQLLAAQLAEEEGASQLAGW